MVRQESPIKVTETGIAAVNDAEKILGGLRKWQSVNSSTTASTQQKYTEAPTAHQMLPFNAIETLFRWRFARGT